MTDTKRIKAGKLIDSLKVRLEKTSLDVFEIFFINHDKMIVEARDGAVDSFSCSTRMGVALRAVKDKKMGFSSSTDFSDDAQNRIVQNLLASVNSVALSDEAIISDEHCECHAIDENLGRPLDAISESEKIAIAVSLEKETKAFDSRVKRIRQPVYEENIRHVIILNSTGLQREFKRGVASCEVRAIAELNNRSESGWEHSFSPNFDDLDVRGTAERASKRALALLGATTLKTGRYDVVFDTRAASQLIRLITPSFFASNVQRNKSALAGKKDSFEYSKLVTIVDHGLLPNGFSSFLFDDEGMPTGMNYLVKDGTISGWLYDSAKAKKDNTKSTGNSFRSSIHHPPAIDVSNCYLCSGNTPVKKIYTMAEGGVLITGLMGLHTANVITGDFSLGAEGFIIKDGVVSQPIRGVLVAGNLHELFKNIVAVGDDLDFSANFGSPSILIPDLQISGEG